MGSLLRSFKKRKKSRRLGEVELGRGRRHGSNPGTVGLGGQRVAIRVPRVRSAEGGERRWCTNRS